MNALKKNSSLFLWEFRALGLNCKMMFKARIYYNIGHK